MRRAIRVLSVVLAFQAMLYLAARVLRARARSGYPDPLDDEVDLAAVLDSVEFASQARALREVRIRNVLGHVALDLRDAVLAPSGLTLEAETTLASTSIVVPRGWRVVVSGVAQAGEHRIDVTPEDDLRVDSPVLRVVARTRLGALTVSVTEGATTARQWSGSGR